MTDEHDIAYDVAYRELRADILSIKAMLMDNRPLEALKVAAEAEDRYPPALEDDE